MNTPSHWLMTIAAGKLIPWARNSPRWALGLGSIAPDLPLYFLSFGGIYYFRNVLGWEDKRVFRHLFSDLYFKDPAWIALHNFLHSPTMLIILLALTLMLKGIRPRLSRWLCFFFSACLLHSIVDVLTHHDDGPVLFFPFNWNYRFSSPVSYWDRNHYGGWFMVFEVLLDIAMLVLIICWRRKPDVTEGPQAVN